jgi:long-chain acyl-CoA synthetase
MLEGWGMTESGALGTFSTVDKIIKPGTIGRATDGVEVRIDPQTGEILMRGRNVFMGYLNQPEKTAETIDSRRLAAHRRRGHHRRRRLLPDHRPDEGHHHHRRRQEHHAQRARERTEVLALHHRRGGDRRQAPYLTVMVMIDQENVEKYAQDHEVPFSNYASLTRAPGGAGADPGEIERVNKKFARVEQIKKFFLLDTQLTAEDEELTPTMKLKRKLVEKKYAAADRRHV